MPKTKERMGEETEGGVRADGGGFSAIFRVWETWRHQRKAAKQPEV